ncbi:hypothetical protein N7481_001528 [Penicillium waksmanii]|uniref:uncharacterized protein n=1 Tax=Penicillium waksmanii TaxID=69791 RepID=UPI002546C52B|nr:uncharacterized protein N7481_001528 [Penicillium waksmanii]KAJ6001119.1 hypothetical protein N7481_001528 [Penicillium waksmanii]
MMANKLLGRAPMRMGQRKRLHSRNGRRVTLPDAPLWMPAKDSEKRQSLSCQPGPLVEHCYPQTENFNHTCLHENPSEESGNRRESLEEARNECGKTCYDRQNSLPELRPSIVSPSNDREKLAEHDLLVRRPTPLDPEAEAMEGQSNTGIGRYGTGGSTDLRDGNDERVSVLTDPVNNTGLTFHGNTVTENCQPQTVSRDFPKTFSSPYPTETLKHSEAAVCQAPGGSNLPDGVPYSATRQLNASRTSTHGGRKGAPIPESHIEVQIINSLKQVSDAINTIQKARADREKARSRNRRWATQDLERLPFWFMQRRHLNKEQIQAEFLADFQHERSFGAIHTAFKRQMRMYHETNHANGMPQFVRDIDQPSRYFVAADNFMHPAAQLGDGNLRDYRSLPPEGRYCT